MWFEPTDKQNSVKCADKNQMQTTGLTSLIPVQVGLHERNILTTQNTKVHSIITLNLFKVCWFHSFMIGYFISNLFLAQWKVKQL